MTLEHDFVDWLYSEIASKGWTNNELARRAGVTSSAMSLLLNKKNNPGLETCVGIAEALGYPPEYVLRKAGLIPPLPASPDDERIKEVREIMRNLPEDDQEEIRQYIWFKLQQYTKRSRNGNHDQP
jgi:transcriptional regulator with XRE-family HTH domain